MSADKNRRGVKKLWALGVDTQSIADRLGLEESYVYNVLSKRQGTNYEVSVTQKAVRKTQNA